MSVADHRHEVLAALEGQVRRKGRQLLATVQSAIGRSGDPSQKGEAPTRQSGSLLNSYKLSIETDQTRFSAKVTSDNPAALPLEFGTPDQAPRPHLRRSLERIAK